MAKMKHQQSKRGQRQNRPPTRAPHGSPIYVERIAICCTPAQKKKFMRLGGSGWLREIINKA